MGKTSKLNQENNNVKSEVDYSLIFSLFTFFGSSQFYSLYKKAKDKYLDDKIKDYRKFLNISIKGGGFILFVFLMCVVVNQINFLTPFSFLLYLIAIFFASIVLLEFLDGKIKRALYNKEVEQESNLSIKNNEEYRDAIKSFMRQANKRDRFLNNDKFFLKVFEEARELLPEEFTKEAKNLEIAVGLFDSFDSKTRELILSKANNTIDKIVEKQIDNFVDEQIRIEEIKERVEQNINKLDIANKDE